MLRGRLPGDTTATAVPSRPDAGPAAPGPLHLHRFAWYSDDPFSGSSLYRCRCGVVRPAL